MNNGWSRGISPDEALALVWLPPEAGAEQPLSGSREGRRMSAGPRSPGLSRTWAVTVRHRDSAWNHSSRHGLMKALPPRGPTCPSTMTFEDNF